jgi:hypothetical protein
MQPNPTYLNHPRLHARTLTTPDGRPRRIKVTQQADLSTVVDHLDVDVQDQPRNGSGRELHRSQGPLWSGHARNPEAAYVGDPRLVPLVELTQRRLSGARKVDGGRRLSGAREVDGGRVSRRDLEVWSRRRAEALD